MPLCLFHNPERKHCSAHSLAGRPNGSGQRAGDQRSQRQRTVSGGLNNQHAHSKIHSHNVRTDGTLRPAAVHTFVCTRVCVCVVKSMTLRGITGWRCPRWRELESSQLGLGRSVGKLLLLHVTLKSVRWRWQERVSTSHLLCPPTSW